MVELSSRSLNAIRCAADILRASKNGVALTGAGISTPSGIPDFRSTNSGLWERYDPFEVASLSAFRYQPERFYDWMHPLVLGMQAAIPNPAHLALARLEQAGLLKAIITQNIDGLHRRAGSKTVFEVHGSLETLTCGSCFQQVSSAGFIQPYLQSKAVPICPACGGYLKPDIVLYGEQLPARTWLKAQEISKKCDVMIVAGSSLEVLPVAGLPMRAVENGAHLIIINHSGTYMDVRADVTLSEDLAEIIPLIVKEALGE
jgi:NAD-dependent deacetylase